MSAPGGHSLETILYPMKQADKIYGMIQAKKASAELAGKEADVTVFEQMIQENEQALNLMKSEQTKYVLIMHPRRLPLFESERLIEALTKVGFKSDALVINEILPQEEVQNFSQFFKDIRHLQEKFVAKAESKFKDLAITKLPMQDELIVGHSTDKLRGAAVYPEVRIVEGPLAKGKDVKDGGGRNNLTGMNFVGFANIVDSLAAIKHLVFTSGEVTFEELARAIGANYAGHEKIQQLLLTRAPKFGNDDDAAVEIARDLFDFYHAEVTRHKTFRGGQFVPGLISATLYMLAGAISAATPDGRPAKFPLAIGGAPATGASRQGPTSAIKSITGIDHKKAAAGIAVNMRFHPSLFETEENLQRFKELVKTYFFELNGQHLQLTVIDSETLKKTKAEPEKHTYLLVRVAGYSAWFVELSPMTQDEIIARTEYACL